MSSEINRDIVASSVTAILFATAIGVSSVSLPLLALNAGFSPSQVGIYVSLSAVAQILTRSVLGVGLRFIEDRTLLAVSALAFTLSFGAVAIKVSVTTLLVGWILQGVARGSFWTGSQSHVIRAKNSPIRAMAILTFFAGIGQLAGPSIAGVLGDHNSQYPIVLGAVICLLVPVPVYFLDRLELYHSDDRSRHSGVWRRPGMGRASWSGVASGGWRSVMDAFLPTVLHSAGHTSVVIGILVSVANASVLGGALLLARIKETVTNKAYALSILGPAACICLIGPTAKFPLLITVMLIAGGLGAGALQTMGPALAAMSVNAHEAGDAIAFYGTVRSSAMFAAPFTLSGIVAVATVSTGLGVVGGLLALPTIVGLVRAQFRSR